MDTPPIDSSSTSNFDMDFDGRDINMLGSVPQGNKGSTSQERIKLSLLLIQVYFFR